MDCEFQQKLKEAFESFLVTQQNLFPEQDVLKVDLHCHDHNSDVPDELIGRILNVPETWLPTEVLLDRLEKNGSTAFTVTNHNNARSCYEMQEKGVDLLTAAEFSCWVPDFEIGIHVLTYGFTREQEVVLEKLRKDLYPFLEYARKHDIPTIWAHPLYHYATKHTPPPAFFRKMLLVFERFEAMNGQRDTWQNLLVKEWLEQATPDEIDRSALEFDIDPTRYCVNPYRKSLSGGSDCHMGIFAGMTGTRLYIPNLKERLRTEPHSQLMLEAIRKGDMAPYGTYQNSEKMTIAFLDYACQIALNYRDPGLVRLLLHKGNSNDKLISFLISNLFCEVQKHKVTTSFIRLFHSSMMGEKPSFLKKMIVKPVYKPIFDEAVNIARKNKEAGSLLVDGYYNSIVNINSQLYAILLRRLEKKLRKSDVSEYFKDKTPDTLIEKLELPSSLRAYLGEGEQEKKGGVNTSEFLDGLSFPFFGSLFMLAAHFTSAKTMFNTRPVLKEFAKSLGKYEHPERVLWLTDTFGDSNGVSVFLQEMHAEIKSRNLPIDIVACSSTVQADDHLVVLQPVKEFSVPAYADYTFRIPNFLELHNLFLSGGYDRIICSTEGIMGLFGLYLKHAYTVQASFYMHTDWLMFARKVLGIEGHNLNRVRRILRFFYQSFDHVLVLNSDQRKWLTGSQMNLRPEQVHQTAHWVNALFQPTRGNKQKLFSATDNQPVLLYVGRISKEKGVLELTSLYNRVKKKHKNVRLVVVGKGPAAPQLKEELPEATFFDWVDREVLPAIYSSADLLILPSRFDTFCNVVLEALSCGLPVVAYNSKGPKDIIRTGQDGYLVNTPQEMQERVCEFLSLPDKASFKQSAIERAAYYQPDAIIDELLHSIELTDAE